jgi:hypothetical protein
MLDDCADELDHVETLVIAHGPASTLIPYLTKYAIVRACGTIEQAFKTVVADHCSYRSKAQVKQFLAVSVRDSSSNPSWDNMCRLLGKFDDNWCLDFKSHVDADVDKTQLRESLKSLVAARNDFAHGGNPSSTIGDVKIYFGHARKVIQYMDTIVA